MGVGCAQGDEVVVCKRSGSLCLEGIQMVYISGDGEDDGVAELKGVRSNWSGNVALYVLFGGIGITSLSRSKVLALADTIIKVR